MSAAELIRKATHKSECRAASWGHSANIICNSCCTHEMPLQEKRTRQHKTWTIGVRDRPAPLPFQLLPTNEKSFLSAKKPQRLPTSDKQCTVSGHLHLNVDPCCVEVAPSRSISIRVNVPGENMSSLGQVHFEGVWHVRPVVPEMC